MQDEAVGFSLNKSQGHMKQSWLKEVSSILLPFCVSCPFTSRAHKQTTAASVVWRQYQYSKIIYSHVLLITVSQQHLANCQAVSFRISKWPEKKTAAASLRLQHSPNSSIKTGRWTGTFQLRNPDKMICYSSWNILSLLPWVQTYPWGFSFLSYLTSFPITQFKNGTITATRFNSNFHPCPDLHWDYRGPESTTGRGASTEIAQWRLQANARH